MHYRFRIVNEPLASLSRVQAYHMKELVIDVLKPAIAMIACTLVPETFLSNKLPNLTPYPPR